LKVKYVRGAGEPQAVRSRLALSAHRLKSLPGTTPPRGNTEETWSTVLLGFGSAGNVALQDLI